MKNSTKYKAWRVIIDSIEGVEVKEDIENNQVVAIKENDIVGLFDLELGLGSIKESSQSVKIFVPTRFRPFEDAIHSYVHQTMNQPYSDQEVVFNDEGRRTVEVNGKVDSDLGYALDKFLASLTRSLKSMRESKWKAFGTRDKAVKALSVFGIDSKEAHKYISELNTSGKTTYEVKYKGDVPVPLAENKPGWMLKQDPVLAAKVKSNINLAKKRQAAYGDPDWQKKQDEKKELAKESWLADDYVTWVDDSSKAKTFTQAEAEIVAKQVNGLASPRFPDGEETDSYVVSNINQRESTELQVRNTFHNRDTHPFYLKIDENGQWWIVNKRTGKQHKPSKNDKETAREEAKAMRENDPFVEPIKEAALPEEDMIGGFRELSVGKNWWYGKTHYDWALKHDLPHELISDHGNRYARVLNTVAYVAVDENDDGTPKLEKWYIKHFQKKED